MNIAFVDDECFFREQLENALSSALGSLGVAVNKIDAYSSEKDFFMSWKTGDYDIILLDIFLDGKNGIDMARKIRQADDAVILVFCSSSNEFAAESYEVKAGYYITKPVSEEKLILMFNRLNLANIERNRTVCLPDGHRCLLRHIIYTEYINHTVVFHFKDEQPHSVYMNHSVAEDLLLGYNSFKQINKGCIVNFAMVKRIDNGVFTMQNGANVPISRRRYKEISDAYTKYRFEKMSEEVGD